MKTVAAIQMASGPNVDANLIEAGRLIASAADQGAKLVVLPENFAQMANADSDLKKIKEPDGAGPIQSFLSKTAKKYSIWLVGGTIPLESDAKDLVRSACLVFNDKGERVARYDKIHLFDVDLMESNESYTESKTIQPGTETVVIDTPFGKLGLAICYDIRFPELFRQLLEKGAEIFAIPSAFTAITGKAHWDSLVRARAIENLCFVVAAAQGGYHVSGRETHGHSMIVDPWGTVLDSLPSGSGTVVADIDSDRLISIRKHFPATKHRRL